MATMPLNLDLLAAIAGRFKALSDPTRLRLLNALRRGERSVTELVEETGLGQANVSKHLHALHVNGLVIRRRVGPFVYYAIVDARVSRLCDLMCDQLRAELDDRRRMIVGGRVTVRRLAARVGSVASSA